MCCTVHGAVEELHVAPEVDHEATEQTEGQILSQGKTSPSQLVPSLRIVVNDVVDELHVAVDANAYKMPKIRDRRRRDRHVALPLRSR